ncbi:unnamed protein product [Musa textilis]
MFFFFINIMLDSYVVDGSTFHASYKTIACLSLTSILFILY